MESKATSIKSRQAGISIAEYVIAMGVAMLIVAVTVGLSIFTGNSFVSTGNLVEMDQASRLALDSMSREIRQADAVVGYKTDEITFRSGTNVFSYAYGTRTKTISRVSNGRSQVLLRDCKYARYDMFQRNATNGTYDYYPTATPTTCKVVQLTWLCSRNFLGRGQATAQQSARVVIRRQR